MVNNNPEQNLDPDQLPEIIPLSDEGIESPKSPDIQEPKKEEKTESPKIEKSSAKEKRFELPDLKEAEADNYSWAKEAESARKFLRRTILTAERELEAIKGGVKENTPLHKAINKKARSVFEQRQARNEAGSSESDFLAAVEETRKNAEFKLEILNSRWQRLEVLSSVPKGANDPELGERAYFKAEEAREKQEQVDDLKCNNEAREELLAELGKKITEKETEPQRREQEKTAILKKEMVESFDTTLNQLKDNPETERLETINKEQLDISYNRTQGFFVELTGEELNSRAKTEAKLEAEKEGKKIFTKEEWFNPERIAKAEQLERVNGRKEAIQRTWNKLSPEEQTKFRGCWDTTPPAKGEKRITFSQHLENKRKELSKQGFFMSRDAFCEGLRQDLGMQDIKVKGWFSKKAALSLKKKGKNKEEFKSWGEDLAGRFNTEVRRQAAEKMQRTYEEGRDRLLRRRIRKTEELVCTVAELKEYKKALGERRLDHEKKTPEQKKVEVLENIDWVAEGKKIKERLDRRMEEIERVVKEAYSLLGLGPQEKLPEEIQEQVSAKREKVKAEYNSAADLLKKRKRIFEEQRKAKVTKEIKEKLAGI